MPEHDHKPQTDLSEFERKLASLRPDREGLSDDSMLYAAGLAEGRRGRPAWAATCAALSAVAFSLGTWGAIERNERRSLAAQLEQRPTSPINTPTATPESNEGTPSPTILAPNGLFAL